MTDDANEKHANANFAVRTSILDAIRQNLEKEKTVNLSSLANIAGAVNNLAPTDLYSKNTGGDSYSKNTQLTSLGQSDVFKTIEDIGGALKK